jgi:LEA14-like dessication related protein
MLKIKSLAWLFVGTIVLSSCASYKDVELKGTENVKFDKLDGGKLSISFDAKLNNQNGYTIKIKPSDLDVYIDNIQIGVIHLTEKVKIKRKSESLVEVPLAVELKPNALLSLGMILLKKKVNVRVTGDVKGGVWFLSKKQRIDETREIDTEKLKFDF